MRVRVLWGAVKPQFTWARAKDVAVGVVRGIHRHDAFAHASSVAYSFFVSLVPLLLVAGYTVGRVARGKTFQTVLEPFFEAAPTGVQSLAERELERLGGASAPMAPLAVVGFLWLASAGFQGLMSNLEMMTLAPRRTFWQKRLHAFGWLLALLSIVALAGYGVARFGTERVPIEPSGQSSSGAASASPSARTVQAGGTGGAVSRASGNLGAGGAAEGHVRGRNRRFKMIVKPSVRAVGGVASMGIGLLFLSLFYRHAVRRPPHVRRRHWPGAFLALGTWLGISWGFGAYVRTLGSYSVYYGSLAVVAVLLVWLWLTALSLLLGAELNIQLEGQRAPGGSLAPSPTPAP
ncbi:MAG: YhjD/YihY/BrkB family envelope integrity protein [Polyangiaceae bacterium]